jgi:hypothetical protein
MVIDETAARTLFPGEDAIGKRVIVGTGLPTEIVGVVGHVKHFGLDDEISARFHLQAYSPALQMPDPFLKFLASNAIMLVLRGRPGATGLAEAVRAEVRNIDPDDVISGVRSMDEAVAGTLASRRFLLMLLGLFALLALVLALVGIYSVLSYAVSQRTREIGVRMALGATRGEIVKLITGRGAALAAGGIVIGVAASLYLTRFLGTVLFGVGRTDAVTFVGVAVALGVVAILASAIPALRGSRADPLAALRCE